MSSILPPYGSHFAAIPFFMHVSKVQLFYPSWHGVRTRFRNFFDVKIAISYEETLFFRFFFFFFFSSSHIELLCGRNSNLSTDSEREHSKIVGYLFQDESPMIQSFFTRFEIRKKIFDFCALMS